MNTKLICYFSLLATVNAFQLPSSIPTRHSFVSKAANVIQVNPLLNSAFSTTALHGKLWKRLETEEDDPADGTSWYLINCVAGVELDLLNQCRHVCEHFPKSDVEKFVVPTERHLRSHGDKKKVVDVKVRYPGYVFCKIRLIEDVYEILQNLELARSWMGTVNRKGHKKLPPSPLPLNEEEVKKFKGLEEAQEIFEDMFAGDYTGRGDTGADLMAQYSGYDVGQMVKVLRGNFDGEDGTVRRLKDGQLMVRMFTYGQTYDEWFDPDAIRPLTDLEVMRGLSGPTTPINQDQFDVSIGKKDPSVLEGRPSEEDMGRTGSISSSLLQNAGVAPGRNRREDRVARGETGNRDMFGRSSEDIKKEEENWLAYREEKRAGQRGGERGGSGDPVEQVEPVKREKFAPPKGHPKGKDTWGIVERSSWTGGEYGFEADSEQEERQRRYRTSEVYKDRPDRQSRAGRGGRGDARGGFDDRRDRNTREERRPARQPRDRDDREDDWSSSQAGDSAKQEDDFFDSLMSELSDDLNDDDSGSGPRAQGSRHHDNAGPNTKVMEKSSGAGAEEDSFFENLMSELGGALDEPASSSSGNAKSERTLDDDDFFSNLEAELSQSLGDFGSNKESEEDESSDDDDDFFASLQQEMGKALNESPSPEKVDEALQDDFFSSLIDDVADELESPSLIDDVADEVKSPMIQETSSKQTSSEDNADLSSLTVPALKDILRSKGLKVGGKKAELIERLQSS
ncbi:hypothetical protein ACHAXR_007035 [Thalassiosira sp. AJA248-18]